MKFTMLLYLIVFAYGSCSWAVLIPKTDQRASDSLFSFLVLGDWGGLPVTPYTTLIELAVAKQMGTVADRVDAQFTLALGDNFYFDGVTDVNDPRFRVTYEKVFDASSLNTPWYFVAGNHDHNGNVSAQIAYTDVHERWRFPNYYYNLKFTHTDGATLEIVMIDTVILCGDSGHDFLHKAPEMPKSVKSIKDAEDQWKWIEKTLANSKADYLIVAGHFPVYSVAEHGSTKCLVNRLLPMLNKYHVQMYLCGHDHNLQHIQVNLTDLSSNFFVVGSANFIEDSQEHLNTVPAGSLKFYWADVLKLGGFGVAQLDKDSLTFRFVDAQTGRTLHGESILPIKNRNA